MPIGKEIGSEIPAAVGEARNSVAKVVPDDFELTDPMYVIDDVIVSQETRREIDAMLSLKRNYEYVYSMLGFSETHRSSRKFIVNFYGDPGTGKTIMAHAVARELGKKLLLIDYSQIESKYVGDTPKNLKRVFDFARRQDCVIFFDEADAILSRRVTNMQSATDTSVNQTRSVLLNILNEFDGDIIFATNFISNYDPAFMRRISRHICFGLPDDAARRLLFEKYTPRKLLAGFDVPAMAGRASGLSAADIEKSTLMAAFVAATDGRRVPTQGDVEAQIDAIKASKLANNGGAAYEVSIETREVEALK